MDEWLDKVLREADDIRAAVADEVVAHGPNRSLAVTLTKLDEAVLWAREYVREMKGRGF